MKGQEKLIKVIILQIYIDNLDKVSKILSLNICKNYFLLSVKYTKSKRINI